MDLQSKETSSAEIDETLHLAPKPEEKEPTSPPTPLAARSRGFFVGGIVAGLAILLGGIYFAAVILRVELPEGTVLVEIGDSDKPVEVNVAKDGTIKIIDPSDGKEVFVTVERGKQTLTLRKEGFVVQTKTFSLKSEDGRHVKVTFVPTKKEELFWQTLPRQRLRTFGIEVPKSRLLTEKWRNTCWKEAVRFMFVWRMKTLNQLGGWIPRTVWGLKYVVNYI